MKTSVVACCICLSIFAGSVSADPGLSIGGSVGNAAVRDYESNIAVNANDIGYKLFGTYMLNDSFGFEGGYIDFGEPDDNVLGQKVALDATGWTFYAVGTLPVGKRFDLFGKAGVIGWDADATLNGVRAGGEDDSDFALSLGLRMNISDNIGLRTEFDWFDVPVADSLWMASFGIEFRF